MDIPDAAFRAADEAVGQAAQQGRISLPRSRDIAVRAAAPHIARAAQVAILRELSEDLLAQRDQLTDQRFRRYGLEEAAQMARRKANELESRQMEVGNE